MRVGFVYIERFEMERGVFGAVNFVCTYMLGWVCWFNWRGCEAKITVQSVVSADNLTQAFIGVSWQSQFVTLHTLL